MKKIIASIIFMLVIGSFSGATKIVNDDTVSEKISSLYMDDDVPTWAIGNYWKYDVDTLIFNLQGSEQVINLDLTVDNLILEVTSTASDSYVLDITGTIAGSFLYDDGSGTTLAGNLYFTRLSGNINFRQLDLAAQQGSIIIKTIALITQHPLAIPIPLPIPLTITLNFENSVPRSFIDFPLYDGKIGNITESFVSANIKVQSIVLKILNIINPDIPAEIYFEQNMSTPEIFYNTTMENVTVKAGEFNAYKIVFYEGMLGSLYYAPEVGNIIKTEAELDMEEMGYFTFNGELKEYSYP